MAVTDEPILCISEPYQPALFDLAAEPAEAPAADLPKSRTPAGHRLDNQLGLQLDDLVDPQLDLQLDLELVPGVGFHPAVAKWFRSRFDGPTPPQIEGWPHIDAGRHTLIAAPTGSGKTLAGFLMAINRLYLEADPGIKAKPTTSVVYVSPLKALAVDIAENLERPLAEIAEVATELGLPVPSITIGVRTGDTPQNERQSMLRKPRTFVVTTPESLYLMVTAAKSRDTLRTVRSVIVDEIHAMARDKRGSHLSLTLERLEHICIEPPARIGLSATQRPIETVARLLVGTRTVPGPEIAEQTADLEIDCAIVDGGHQRSLDVQLELPDSELDAVASHAQMDNVLDRIAELVGEHKTTLVFVNTRRLAERLAHQLGERLGDDVVAAHHGSLSKDRRHRVERRLRAGELKALVATASLELGIDVGPVELVCQIGSPRSIATFLQRVGRSNHTRHGTPRGRLYPLTRDELIECTALLGAIRAGRLDALEPPVAPLDILAQQLVAETGAEEWQADELFNLVRRAHPFSTLTRDQFDEVVELVCDGIITGRGRRAAWVHRDETNGELRGRRGARYVALTSGGAIPEIYDMRVIMEPDETFIGTVNEDWAMESMAGDIFLLGTHSWRIRQVTGGEVRVVDAGDAPPTVPFWTGEAPARTAELSAEVSRLRAAVDSFLDRDDPAGATNWLTTETAIPTDAAALIVAYLATGRAVLGRLPTSSELVMERFFDDADGMQLVIHSPLGGRINRAMGYALRKKFCVGFNFELQAAASDDAVVISLGPHHSFPLTDVQQFLRPENIRETLTQAILDQPAFQSRWRWNLNRALIVQRMRNGKRNPPPIQRMESDDLLAALFPDAAACQENVTGPVTIPDHPVVRQTIHDTLTEGMDVDGLIALWQAFADGSTTMHHVDTTEPSVLAYEILTARPYAFLDDDELPDRRTHAAPMRRGLPVDLTDIGALVPEAVAEVRAELAPDPRTADELHDLLRDVILLRARPQWAALFEELQAKGRVDCLAGESTERWYATESAQQVQVLLSDAPNGEIFPEHVAATVLRGHLELLSPITADALRDETGIPLTSFRVGLATLESEGSAIQGHFSTQPPDGGGESQPGLVEWCSRRLLARMHGRSRNTRRKAAEPVSPEQFMRFLVRWQHVAPGTQVRSPAGLAQVLEQLQGWGAAVASWESDLLTARIRNYDSQWVDRLCHNGEIQWLRLAPRSMDDPDRRGSGPSKATPISIVYRHDLPWLLPATRGEATAPLPSCGAVAEIAEALQQLGPRFAADLAADTGRLSSDIETALWDGVARGLFTADGFEAIRALTGPSRKSRRRERSLSRLRRRSSGIGESQGAGIRSGGAGATGGGRSTQAAGRWSLVPGALAASPPPEDRDELVEAVADQLLQRWGVLFYDLVRVEDLAVPWRELQWALRRLEDRGLIAGGRFVKGFSGEQFALPAAVEALKDIRKTPPTGETVSVCGTDPLNLTNVILSGDRIPARRSETVVLPI
ncbi:MAG: DEAD/DEAH box helicase [Acidimicrobiales bacterium]